MLETDVTRSGSSSIFGGHAALLKILGMGINRAFVVSQTLDPFRVYYNAFFIIQPELGITMIYNTIKKIRGMVQNTHMLWKMLIYHLNKSLNILSKHVLHILYMNFYRV